jgi:type IV secretion system protein VirD4
MKRLWAMLVRLVLLLALGLFTVNAVTVGLQYPWLGVVAATAAGWQKLRRGRGATGSYGTARAATLYDLIRHKLMCERGWILGKVSFMAPPTCGQAIRSLLSPYVDSVLACRLCFSAFGGSRMGGDGIIRINDGIHAATFAPSGGGKTVKVLAPNLFSYEGNVVVVDAGRGELFRLTAEHRRKKMGHTIVRMDPAQLCGPGANRFNPLDFINPQSKEFVDQCRDHANMMTVRTGKELDPHWNDSAENVIAAFIAYVCAREGNPEARTLRNMRTFLAARHLYTFALDMMQQSDEEFFGVLQQLGNQLRWHVEKELGSVMTHAQRHTNIFDSPLVADSTSGTDWNPAELRSGRMTVYLIVPANRLVIWAGLQRLWLGSILRIITRGVPTEKNPVLFMVDECAHIGRMQALEDAVTLMRGMGIRLWLFFQSIDQLNKCFGDRASTVLDNLATQQYFCINSYETAEILSKRIGDQTIVVRTEGGNDGWSRPFGGDGKAAGSRNTGTSITITEIGRRYIKPEEILTLPENVSLVFHKNHYVMFCECIKYYSDKAFRYRRGRGYGTGRSRGVGLGGMVLALAALAMSGVVTAFVASLPVPAGPRPGAIAPGGYFMAGPAGRAGAGFREDGPVPWGVEPWEPPVFQPAPYGPGLRQRGRRPLPYRRGLRPSSVPNGIDSLIRVP